MSVIVKRTGKDDLSLPEGTKLLGVTSSQSRRLESEWKMYRLWQTPEGKFVAGKAALSYLGFTFDENKYEAEIFTDREDVVAYFGLDKIARYLYRQAGWQAEAQMG